MSPNDETMSHVEYAAWQMVMLSRDLASMSAASLLPEIDDLRRAEINIHAAIARAEKESRHAA